MQEDEHKTNGGREPGVRRNLNCALKTVKSSEQNQRKIRGSQDPFTIEITTEGQDKIHIRSLSFLIYRKSALRNTECTRFQRRWNKWKRKEITTKCLA